MAKKKQKSTRRPNEIECVDFIIKFGERVRNIRNKKGWTLEQCEERGYPSWKHLGDIETGKKVNMNFITMLRIANLFGMKPYELIKGIKLGKF